MKVVDMHCDTISVILNKKREGENIELRENNLNVDILKMKKGDYLLQNFAMFVNLQNVKNPLEECLSLIDCFYTEIEKNKDMISLALSYDDIIKNKNEGKMSALLTVEEGGTTCSSLSNLRILYRLGVRMITLTWNYPNGIGWPNIDLSNKKGQDFHIPNTKDGLTNFGIEFVQEMERLGIIIDVSHLSDAGFEDVLRYTTKPFVASHSNSRSVTNNVRNLTDDMILKIAQRGGVIGINFAGDFLEEPKTGKRSRSKISNMIKHIKHIVNLAGIDCVGLGSDFDGIYQDLELDNASKMPELEKALKLAGFSYNDIEKIFYKNVLRVYKEILK
ncbi:membrane dipeptidase [Clostridium sp. USBA 49]|uniref:dipeptidase n=1 Tax=Clostridium sp. USBA 49 TaxID=1881060 RepID=UPI00099A09D0|nr:dipeptidase [Clostridium sp. USBA 49]SKA86362.1 membrane dipeptidase [Clostridium sp. USBA 49]